MAEQSTFANEVHTTKHQRPVVVGESVDVESLSDSNAAWRRCRHADLMLPALLGSCPLEIVTCGDLAVQCVSVDDDHTTTLCLDQ